MHTTYLTNQANQPTDPIPACISGSPVRSKKEERKEGGREGCALSSMEKRSLCVRVRGNNEERSLRERKRIRKRSHGKRLCLFSLRFHFDVLDAKTCRSYTTDRTSNNYLPHPRMNYFFPSIHTHTHSSLTHHDLLPELPENPSTLTRRENNR